MVSDAVFTRLASVTAMVAVGLSLGLAVEVMRLDAKPAPREASSGRADIVRDAATGARAG